MASELERDARKMRENADLTTMDGRELQTIVSERHAEAFAAVPVGDMRELGPSIVNLQVWDVAERRIEFGTAVEHANKHADWREENLGEPLLYADEELSDRIFDAWSDHVFAPLLEG